VWKVILFIVSIYTALLNSSMEKKIIKIIVHAITIPIIQYFIKFQIIIIIIQIQIHHSQSYYYFLIFISWSASETWIYKCLFNYNNSLFVNNHNLSCLAGTLKY